MAEKENKKEPFVSPFVEKQDVQASRRFQEQCFLMFFIQSLANANKEKNFPFLSLLETNASVSDVKNKLFSLGLEEYFNLTPAQQSLLVPYFELFKVFRAKTGKEVVVPLPFDNFTDPAQAASITSGQARRGGGVGLKSFEWKDMGGGNPAFAGKYLEGTLVLGFNSVDDIYKIRATRNGFSSTFADLFRPAGLEGADETGRNISEFEIRVKVGWSVPDVRGASPLTPNQLNAIRNSQRVLVLSRTRSKLDFKEDGRIEATITMIGAIEAIMDSPDTDILLLNRELNEVRQIVQTQEQAFLDNENRIKGEAVQKVLNREIDNATLEVINRGLEARKQYLRDNPEVAQSAGTKLDPETIQLEARTQAWSRTMKKLIREKKIRALSVTPEEATLLGFVGSRQTTNEEAAEIRAATLSNRPELIRGLEEKIVGNQFAYDLSQGTMDSVLKQNIRASLEQKTSQANYEDGLEAGSDPSNYNIFYFYLGDLLNAAMEVFYNKGANMEDHIQTFNSGDRSNYRLVLGEIEVYDPVQDTIFNVNLADIPISMKKFQEWWVKKVVKPDRRTYLLKEFLTHIITQLIIPITTNECKDLNFISQTMSSKINFDVFSVAPTRNIFQFGKRINVDAINRPLNATYKPVEGNISVLLISASRSRDSAKNGNRNEDLKKGIQHFNIGADRGILKSVSFSRNDIPKITEAEIQDAALKQRNYRYFPEPYNAKVKLFGTPIFANGMNIYIDPRSFGTPSDVDSKRIPVGGYYSIRETFNRITPQGYETELEATWVSWRKDVDPAKRITRQTQKSSMSPSVEDPELTLSEQIPDFERDPLLTTTGNTTFGRRDILGTQ